MDKKTEEPFVVWIQFLHPEQFDKIGSHPNRHIIVSNIEAHKNLARQETFRKASGVLKDIIERIKKQNDIYWDTGNKDKTAYVVPKSIVKQFEITLNAMVEVSQEKQEKEHD